MQVTDQLSPAFTFVSATPTCRHLRYADDGRPADLHRGDLADQGTVTVVVHMHVPSSYNGSDAPDVATVTSSTTDPDQPDNDATYTVSGAAAPTWC